MLGPGNELDGLANGGLDGTASSKLPSRGKHESVSYMPLSVPTAASGSTSSETCNGGREVERVTGGSRARRSEWAAD